MTRHINNFKRVTEFNRTWALAHPREFQEQLASEMEQVIQDQWDVRLVYSGHQVYLIAWNPAHSHGELEL